MKRSITNKEKDLIYKNTYRNWKLESLESSGYFIIFQGFLETDLLKKISGNALKLYIYLGINSNNLNGVVWHSNKKISAYFNKSERTIRLWMKELEDLNLLKRMRLKYNGNVFTYLQTYNSKLNLEDKLDVSTIEGYLLFDSIGGLYIESDNMYIPVTRNMNIEIFYNSNWIFGEIQTRRFFNNYENNSNLVNISYYFISKKENLELNINDSEMLKVKVTII
ncbi:helix-turn-helix domain-containing protein [Clostridioides difficile]|uniref:helix-turn-helix domain-containing protein n=1 Tax=Clostridioides difficile TaxID=1496 RepID=UPI001FACF32D|nr:helix-turn-helix domain-containing protein [Clostridioides difficile]MCJ0222438.1 helix-turn-helix domain-containing protein [Clostridioides difficile]MCJ0429058.1 helix-turn-helix domain-containing protein [Clostridioides difficile]MCJ0435538.1 helix-turn-helix domain-containing protein [Clostridioides difficile]MCU6146639.1 helix-turn-helix domain-containing protein [Clostridioides difficile]